MKGKMIFQIGIGLIFLIAFIIGPSAAIEGSLLSSRILGQTGVVELSTPAVSSALSELRGLSSEEKSRALSEIPRISKPDPKLLYPENGKVEWDQDFMTKMPRYNRRVTGCHIRL